jgi:hypothetical protein
VCQSQEALIYTGNLADHSLTGGLELGNVLFGSAFFELEENLSMVSIDVLLRLLEDYMA